MMFWYFLQIIGGVTTYIIILIQLSATLSEQSEEKIV
jgi:hypothetical protein